MGRNPQPAMRTAFDERYSDCEHVKKVGSDTRFVRGLGESGTRVDIYDMSAVGGCPRCSESEMVVSRDLNPGSMESDACEIFCTNVACSHFVQDAVEYDHTLVRAEEPSRWDQTVRCPDCDRRHTIEVEQHNIYYEAVKEARRQDRLAEVVCDECMTAFHDEVEA